MSRSKGLAKRALVAVIAVGLLTGGSLAVVGEAGAATATAAPVPGSKVLARVNANFNCAKANKRLTLIAQLESRTSRKLVKLQKLEAKATAAKHTHLAAYWQKLINKQNKHQTKMLGRKWRARANEEAKAISAKCHVPIKPFVAPAKKPATGTTSTTSPPTTGAPATTPTTGAPSTTVPAPSTTTPTSVAPVTTTTGA